MKHDKTATPVVPAGKTPMKLCGTGSALNAGMFPTPAHIDEHTEKIIGCAIEVHKTFGAGLLESVYRECMAVELKNAGLQFESERLYQAQL